MAIISGTAASETLTGTAGADTITGAGGHDTIAGLAGNDWLSGGADNDKITGHIGHDLIAGDDGADWLSGDVGNDSIEGGEGNDTLAGGDGNDTLVGGTGNDTMAGGAGNDRVTGGAGIDVADLGAGNDVFFWEADDNSDTVRGGAGYDVFQVTGAAAPATTRLGAFGALARVGYGAFSYVELDDFERVDLRPLDDAVFVSDLRGTDVKQVLVDLSGKVGGTAADGFFDSVNRDGTTTNDTITVASAGSKVSVTGLSASVTISYADATDRLNIDGLGGNDIINASKLAPGLMQLSVDGGAGNDRLTASKGDDSLSGGEGNDVLVGDDGKDNADLGAGDDWFLWNSGDGSDTLKGGLGFDTLRVTSSNADERITISAVSGAAWIEHDRYNLPPAIDAAIATSEIERIEVRALGGADPIFVEDLTGTQVTEVAIDLAATAGGKVADNKVERVFIYDTAGDDIISIGWSGGKIVTTGLPATVSVARAGATDVLQIFSFNGGDNIINAAGLPAGKVSLELVGGSGNDVIFGSAGHDFIDGRGFDDVAYMGAGNDLYAWEHGDDKVEGQEGTDTARVDCFANDETINIFASGERAQVYYESAVLNSERTLDLNDVERIVVEPVSGTDKITVDDLTGTDVKQVVIDLSDESGGGDGETDTIVANAGDGNNTINIALAGTAVSVTGLAATLTIAEADAADSLRINGEGGNDKIGASSLSAGLLALTLDGGAGNDTITGSRGNDVLHGGDSNDVVAGDDGIDTAFLGDGDDLFLSSFGDGNDVVEGQDGLDTLRLTGVNAGDTIAISANGSRTQVVRIFDAAILDLDGIERIEVQPLKGADKITVNDLTGTAVTEVAVDLAAAAGGKTADLDIDTVTFNGTGGADIATFTVSGSKIAIATAARQFSVDHASAADRLIFEAGAGNDTINAGALAAGKISLQLAGGIGADTITGSAGNDLFVWNVGDGKDAVAGEGGTTDTAVFNGNNSAEDIRIFQNGGQVQVRHSFVTVADLDDVERLRIFGGDDEDNVVVNSLVGTDLKLVSVDLAGSSNVADGVQDLVSALGTAGNDKITIGGSAAVVSVTGLSAQVTVAHADASDILSILADAGNDTINAATLAAGPLTLSLQGGVGNDVITGSARADAMDGGADNDIVRGGGGSDSLSGGAGNDNLDGGTGHDTVTGGAGNDTIGVGSGNDVVRYTSALDGHDLITGFDGNAAGGQDTLDLEALFDSLGVAAPDRAGRVSIVDSGSSVAVRVDADGNAGNGFELAAATLKTVDAITVGQDVLVGT